MPNDITSFQGEYRFLSNFWPCPVRFEQDSYSSVEHAYQAAKTDDREIRRQIAFLTPGGAKRFGRFVPLKEGWNGMKLQVMEKLVERKFVYTPNLGLKLLATGDVQLIEGNA